MHPVVLTVANKRSSGVTGLAIFRLSAKFCCCCSCHGQQCLIECTLVCQNCSCLVDGGEMICGVLTLCALQFTEAVVNLKFDEDPKYAAYSSLFEPLCGATPARPILQTDAPKVCSCFCSLSAIVA